MKRDGITTSLWQQEVSHIPIPTVSTTASHGPYDVIIIGAGITGLTTGLLLQETGKKCLILEAHNIAFGTSSGTSAHLNTLLDTPYPDIISKFGKENARLIAQAAAEAIAIIKNKINTYDILCDFEYKDGYLFAQNPREEEELSSIAESLEQVGIEAEYTSKIPVPIPFTNALRFSGQAQFHPLKYISALAEQFLAGGGKIIEHLRVTDTGKKGDLLVVDAGGQQFTAQHVVYATHIPPGINLLHFRCAPYRSYIVGVELNDDSYPAALCYDMEDPYHYFRTVLLEDRKILLVGGNDHKTGHAKNTEYVFTDLEAYVRKYFDVGSVPYKWSAQYYEPADGLPYIGHLPGADENIYVATGYSGNGLIFGTLAGQILSDLIVTGNNPYASLLSPSRIKPVAGFSNFIKENADVLKHFVADRLSSDTLSGLSDLSHGEGRIVKYQEKQIAIYKDEQGNIKALHPVCPHAGCIVQWNTAEQSWDCPCHGARYDTNGQPLNGPTTAPLKPLDIA